MEYLPVDFKSQSLKIANNQCLVVYSCNDKCIPLHKHDFIEMQFILSGLGKEVINGIEHELKSGSLSILLPWHIHEIIPDAKKPLEMITCSFKLEMFIDKNNFIELDDLIFGTMDTPAYINFESADFKLVTNIFNQLLREYTDQNLWKNIIFKAKITEIFVLFGRCKKSTSVVNSTNRKLVNNQVIWDIIYFIQLHCYKTSITLSYIAQKFDLDAKYLNMHLKQNTGLNFNDLLNEARIRIACTLLLYSAQTFSLVSEPSLSQLYIYLGYKTKQAFLKAFKKFKGLSPEEFKEKYFSNYNTENPLSVVPKIYLTVIYYLHLNYNKELTLADISKQFHSNENYISSLLKSQTGQNFNDLLDEVRTFHACDLLKYTNKVLN